MECVSVAMGGATALDMVIIIVRVHHCSVIVRCLIDVLDAQVVQMATSLTLNMARSRITQLHIVVRATMFMDLAAHHVMLAPALHVRMDTHGMDLPANFVPVRLAIVPCATPRRWNA